MHGLYLLWWVQEKGIPAPIVAAVLAAGDLALLLAEIPTGWFADRVGHRTSLVAGSLLQVLGMLLCWLGGGVPDLVAASVLVALGDGFRSGADQALLYRSCQALESEEEFQRLEARAHAAQQMALVALVLAGGVIVERWGFAAGWIAETLLCAVGLLIACAMTEPPSSVEGPREPTPRRSGLVSVEMLVLLMPAALLGAAAVAGAFLAQTSGSGSASSMSMLVAVITLAEAFGAALATRAGATGVRSQMSLLAAGVLFGGAALAVPAAFLPAVVLLSCLTGLADPLRAAAIQRLASDDERARAASVSSACNMACSLVALTLAGVARGRRSPRGG
jgi:hypothetical protein